MMPQCFSPISWFICAYATCSFSLRYVKKWISKQRKLSSSWANYLFGDLLKKSKNSAIFVFLAFCGTLRIGNSIAGVSGSLQKCDVFEVEQYNMNFLLVNCQYCAIELELGQVFVWKNNGNLDVGELLYFFSCKEKPSCIALLNSGYLTFMSKRLKCSLNRLLLPVIEADSTTASHAAQSIESINYLNVYYMDWDRIHLPIHILQGLLLREPFHVLKQYL